MPTTDLIPPSVRREIEKMAKEHSIPERRMELFTAQCNVIYMRGNADGFNEGIREKKREAAA